ncbi:sensor histidine kinase [Actinomadura alba]|uniref:histidine kinase n=1 Tax=Actinomadura alba TaxID=406431 RepID=A0ABR7LXT8_9ACTN|nr:HAMP domain-containing sensor histidine kinase [Actinomadura alba]MBC6469666.1 HAMP domain-containing histidine kinase [Actinomadura alba]
MHDAAHQLRGPITGLRTRLEEAGLHPEDAPLRDLAAGALRDVGRLEQIVNDLLLLAGIDAGVPREREIVDLAELVEAEVSQRADRIPVRCILDREVIVNAVPDRFAQLLGNLLDNGQRHADRNLEIEVYRSGDRAELTVADDGDGIAETDRERVFERFTRLAPAVRRDGNGTGLGLAIAREIAHDHGGTLHVGDSPFGGARFVLRLPLA